MGADVQLSLGGPMRGNVPESSSRYLSMALASRKLMKHLDLFNETGTPDELMLGALRNLLAVMDTSWQTDNSFAPVPGRSPFGRYEQAIIVNEVAEPFDSKVVSQKLKGILDGTIQAAERGSAVHDINEFLYDLENRSLHAYSEQSNKREW